jgi:hypothetical protein
MFQVVPVIHVAKPGVEPEEITIVPLYPPWNTVKEMYRMKNWIAAVQFRAD